MLNLAALTGRTDEAGTVQQHACVYPELQILTLSIEFGLDDAALGMLYTPSFSPLG
jgi:hypothetical protein